MNVSSRCRKWLPWGKSMYKSPKPQFFYCMHRKPWSNSETTATLARHCIWILTNMIYILQVSEIFQKSSLISRQPFSWWRKNGILKSGNINKCTITWHICSKLQKILIRSSSKHLSQEGIIPMLSMAGWLLNSM